MNGETLKNLLKKTGLSVTDIAAKIGVTPQALNSTFNSPDVKSSIIEKVASMLNLPVSYLYGEERQTINAPIYGDSNAVAGINSTASVETTDNTRLYNIIEKQNAQIEKLTELLINKK